MSRGQENQVFGTASGQNAQEFQNAQNSYKNAQGDVQDYQDQLSKFAAANPYGSGGEFQTSENKVLANTSDAAAQAAGQTLQAAAVRGGQNAGSSIAATEAIEQQNARNLSGQEGEVNAQRIGDEAGYNDKVLSASSVPASLETALSGQQGTVAEGDLGIEQKAGETPSFLDTLGSSFAGALGSGVGTIASAGIQGAIGCWIAARIFGGWDDPRTKLVRLWLSEEFSRSWYGSLIWKSYQRWGKKIADEWMPRSSALTWLLTKIFNAALVSAELWLLTKSGSLAYGQMIEGVL